MLRAEVSTSPKTDSYKSFPVHRVRTMLVINPELIALVKRRPIEVVSGIDIRGEWLFGIELRVVNELTLAKLRVLSPDSTTISIASAPLKVWPDNLEIRHIIVPFGQGESATVIVNCGDESLELDSLSTRLHELRTFAPNGQELIAPWFSLALTA